ncbi:MAG TPA: winged helix-turn-helix domain-containing protein [Terriglobales bacterium]|nr:winged helix-turn-helix domain-containing protein [Terriglobales bacterium]
MDRLPTTELRIGEWRVSPASGQISRDGQTSRLDVRTMRLLLCLAEKPGEVVSIDDLLNQVWSEVNVTQDSVYQAVTSLRRVLGDDPKNPAYIETVPRLGYRMVAAVGPWVEPSSQSEQPSNMKSAGNRRGVLAVAAGVVICFLLVAALFHNKGTHSVSPVAASQPQNSIAVLPFLDLTEGMKEEEFADGLTEELIGRLSKVPGLRVPSPTSSFYFKDKQVPVAEIGKSLGVVYVIDGSVRKSGNRVRIATRLVQAAQGYVVWSETYDRSMNDILAVQDDIADKVTKALRPSIEGTSQK